ncbi:hypothetical protein JR316_0000543 [Psilocybe cubensis]|uniref:Uncharacterized protein n=1 Tax=Psilocybe cubensis TaxID=181762 RepID=A0ACB8HF94_PSICU|nr:hypothetical protein JR316_0000543 [Psilocybe cubensis]KAH9486478.1 hypothetical protein JR316_0000543 [Psilocybe cubensis]
MPPAFRGSSHSHRLSNSYSSQPVSSTHSPPEYGSSRFMSAPVRPIRLTAPPSHWAQNPRERHHDHEQHIGAEPGVNPRSGDSIAEYSHFKQDCVIEVYDYDSEDVSFQRFTNAGLISFLKKREVDESREHGEIPPRMVRWINIGGIDWSVLSAIALRYNLHSLALEDILHERGHTHSKADYYPGHLFLRVLCHTLSLPHATGNTANELPQYTEEGSANGLGDLSREVSDDPDQKKFDVEEGGMDNSLESSTLYMLSDKPNDALGFSTTSVPKQQTIRAKGKTAVNNVLPSSLRKRFSALSGIAGPSREEKRRQIRALTAGDRVFVNHDPMFIFLLHDGTVISIHPTLNLHYTAPIAERLHRVDSVLRTSEDASLLVESLLDLVVDRVLEIVDEYQVKIDKLEHDILLNPVMRSVRSLHILSGDLILHKRTLEPIRTMVYGLRRYDLERSRALADNIALEIGSSSDTDSIETEGKATGKQNVNIKKHSKATLQAHKRKRRLKQLFEAEYFARHDGSRDSHLNEGDSATSLASGLSGYPTKHQHSIDQEKIKRAKEGGTNVHGYFSYKAKVYLADVSDHMDFALTSLDMFAGISENLINYAFNVSS